jgi:hypothetical protein
MEQNRDGAYRQNRKYRQSDYARHGQVPPDRDQFFESTIEQRIEPAKFPQMENVG